MFTPDMTSGEKTCPWDLMDTVKVFSFYLLAMTLGSAILIFGFRKFFGQDVNAVFGENAVVLTIVMLTNGLSCLYFLYIVNVRLGQPVATLGMSLSDWKRNLFL
ncbi:MAG: hypothetical protein V3V54_00200, partial [Candidatus Brocadiales bacterium]